MHMLLASIHMSNDNDDTHCSLYQYVFTCCGDVSIFLLLPPNFPKTLKAT